MAGEQSAANVIVAMLAEATPGTPATPVGSAERIRLTGGSGLKKTKAIARSNEKRADGTQQKGRHSTVSVAGAHEMELTSGGAIDDMIEAIMRATWAATDSDGFVAVFTSIALSSNVLTATGGSFVTAGYRVGQVVYFTAMEDSENDNVNCMVRAVTASTLTVAPANGVALTDNAADTGGTIHRLGNIITAAAPTKRHFTVDQYDQDIDQTEQFVGCVLVGLRLVIAPGQPVTVTATWMGFDSNELAGGASPYFTSPALSTGLAMVGDEITLDYNGAVATTFTSLTIDLIINGAPQGVLGSVVTPDVFTNDFRIEGSASIIRSDFAELTLFDAETEFDLGVLLENRATAAPYDCVGIWLPVVTIDDVATPVGGGDGPKIQTLTLGIGTAVAVTGLEATPAVISSSAVA